MAIWATQQKDGHLGKKPKPCLVHPSPRITAMPVALPLHSSENSLQVDQSDQTIGKRVFGLTLSGLFLVSAAPSPCILL